MLIYAWDERQSRAAKKKRLREKHQWGTFRTDGLAGMWNGSDGSLEEMGFEKT